MSDGPGDAAPATSAGDASRVGALSGAERGALAALLVAAAALRWIAWERTVVLFNDGPRFLGIARAFDAGHASAALRDAFHPLYPLLVAGVHRALGFAPGAGGWEDAGALVSVVAGTAAVGFAFLFLRDAFGRAAGWGGALLLAVHSRAIEYASDVQSDALYLALFAAGLWLGWGAWRRESVARAAGAGAAAGLAYLTRPEGLGLALVLALLGAARALRRQWTPARALAWGAALVGAAALLALPYLVALERTTGAWQLTRKKDVPVVADAARAGGGAPAPPPWLETLGSAAPAASDPGWIDPEYLETDGMAVATASGPAERAWEALRMLVRHARSALRYPVSLLVVAGLVAARGRPGPRGVFAAALGVAYLAVLYALTAGAGYVSRRHALPPLLPLFGYAGAGALALAGWGARRFGGGARAASLAGAALLAAVAAGELTAQIEPKRAEELPARRAAEWLREHAPAPGPVAAARQRLGYYAGLPYVSVAGIADDALARYLSSTGARYVLLDDRDQVEALLRVEESRMRVLHHVTVDPARGRRGGEAWVLERVPAGDAGAGGAPAGARPVR